MWRVCVCVGTLVFAIHLCVVSSSSFIIIMNYLTLQQLLFFFVVVVVSLVYKSYKYIYIYI